MNKASHRNKIVLLAITSYSNLKYWSYIFSLIKKDSKLSDMFEIVFIEIDEKLSLKENSKQVYKFISGLSDKYIYMMAYSIESYIIFNLLHLLLLEESGKKHVNIKRVVLLSLPSIDKKFLIKPMNRFSIIKYLVLSLWGYPQYKVLKYMKNNLQDLLKIKNFIYEKIIDTKENTEESLMIPIAIIYGDRDILTNTISLKSFIGENIFKIKGNHSLCLNKISEKSEVWIEIRKNLILPLGHKNILEVKKLKIEALIKSTPLSIKEVVKWQHNETIIEEHKGELRYSVDFSERNISRNKFQIKFSVSSNAFIREIFSNYKNEADPPTLGKFTRSGEDYEAQLNPREKSGTYKTILEVTNGFSDAQFWDKPNNNRNELTVNTRELNYSLSFQLGKGEHFYQEIEINLTLAELFVDGLVIYDIKAFWLPFEVSAMQKYHKLITGIMHHNSHDNVLVEEISSGHYAIKMREVDCGSLVITWSIYDSRK